MSQSLIVSTKKRPENSTPVSSSSKTSSATRNYIKVNAYKKDLKLRQLKVITDDRFKKFPPAAHSRSQSGRKNA